MSYDIHLKEPVTGNIAEVPGHLMTGGTYKADYHPEIGIFTPALNTEAKLNITYNYSHYYYETYEKEGIRTIYGMSGIESIPILEKMLFKIEERYKKDDDWIVTKRTKTIYYGKNDIEIDICDIVFNDVEYVRKREVEFEVSEGDTTDYWLDTAANAMKPLYQLIALARMRPDCIWDGD